MTNVIAVVLTTQFNLSMQRHQQENVTSDTFQTPKHRLYAFLRELQDKIRRRMETLPLGPRGRRMLQIWRRISSRAKSIVESEVVETIIFVSICASVLDLALEHHNQPVDMTKALYGANIILNIVFVLEMIMRIIGDVFHYFRDLLSLLEFIVIISSAVEMLLTHTGILAAFRALRVLRLMRLIKSLPYLQKQMMILMKTVKHSASLFLLMGIFIFISGQWTRPLKLADS
ncbi:hypothetical protein WMY93_031794 [Mugilogobius chulae]|uniref:Ion transport domain-containing protein n=1 Tax=Mugilogobius chulae TaxID=88201 RepID=A0AAW0MF71_9GOBI